MGIPPLSNTDHITLNKFNIYINEGVPNDCTGMK